MLFLYRIIENILFFYNRYTVHFTFVGQIAYSLQE